MAKLLISISLAYPRFSLYTAEGKVNGNIVEEWYKRIGYKSYKDADRMFEEWLKADNKSAPNIGYFMGQQPEQRKSDVYVDDRPGRYKLEKGVLYWCVDGEEYEIGNPDEEPYYLNSYGSICRMHNGQEVVIQR